MKKNYTIDMQFYPIEALTQAVSDFQEVVEMELFDNILAIAGENDEEIDEIFNEFMNYVL
jgi:hypothetical protein